MKVLSFFHKEWLTGRHGQKRRGMTLIELIVVASIMSMLMVIAMPVLAPVAEDRASREAVRALQSALDTARMRASKLGRPCGLALIPYGDYPSACLKCEHVTTPPNYSGDSLSSTCTVSGNRVSLSDERPDMIKKGNWIRINNTGPWFYFSANGTIAMPKDAADYVPIWQDKNLGSGHKFPYTIRRYPIDNPDSSLRKPLGLDPPVTFPQGTIIDLYYSGVGIGNGSGNVLNPKWQTLSSGNKGTHPPIMIMFNPGGGAEIYYNGQPYIVGTTIESDYMPKIYLLVGKWHRGLRDGNKFIEPPDGKTNLEDENSFWVVINPRTGLVTSVPNNPVLSGNPDAAGAIPNARKFAKPQKNAMGGQ